MLPYLIIAGNGKCYLQVMELHRADGVEPVHYLLRMEQDRTERLARATVGHLNSPSCTQPCVNYKHSQLSLRSISLTCTQPASTAAPFPTCTGSTSSIELLPHKPTQPVLLPCSLQQNSLTDTQTQSQNPHPITYSNSHSHTPSYPSFIVFNISSSSKHLNGFAVFDAKTRYLSTFVVDKYIPGLIIFEIGDLQAIGVPNLLWLECSIDDIYFNIDFGFFGLQTEWH